MLSHIEKNLLDVLKTNVEIPEKVSLDCGFEEMGVNSINYIKLVVAVETKFGFEFDDDDLDYTQFKTPHDLISYIRKHVQINTN